MNIIHIGWVNNFINERINMCTFSIIVPHFNSVESVLNLLNTIPEDSNIETIVVDDKSTDDISQLINKIEQISNAILLKNETYQKGAGVCRNIGLRRAVGKWVLFADADDFFLKEFMQNIESKSDMDDDIIFFMPTSIKISSGKKSSRSVPYSRLISEYLSSNCETNLLRLKFLFEAPWSKLYKREMIEKNQITFDATIVSNDVMFCTKAAYFAKKISASPEPIYCVTESENTLTTTKNVKNFRLRISVFIQRYRYLVEHLGEKKMRMVRLSGRSIVKNALLIYGIREACRTIFILKKNHIRINFLAR